MKMKKLVAMLLATALFAGALSGCASSESNTVKWINTTYATLTAANGKDISLIGGYKKNAISEAAVKAGLEESWDVTDKASADENLAWILDEGHRATFATDMTDMEAEGLMELSEEELTAALIAIEFTEEEAANLTYMVSLYKTKGATAIDAWDYCRALQLLGWYYVAGYYEKNESLDKSLEIAKELQTKYTSWDELCTSYLDGYNYWASDDRTDPESDTATRIGVYEELKAGKDSPYTLAWDTVLENTWSK